jgi:hypothetical protein
MTPPAGPPYPRKRASPLLRLALFCWAASGFACAMTALVRVVLS